jgi:hypothetical protein
LDGWTVIIIRQSAYCHIVQRSSRPARRRRSPARLPGDHIWLLGEAELFGALTVAVFLLGCLATAALFALLGQ